MGRSIEFHPEARAELVDAASWYAARNHAAAKRFESQIESKLLLVMERPERWPFYEAGTRRILLERFPYSIIFISSDEVIQVIAIMHHKREPGYWLDRVAGNEGT